MRIASSDQIAESLQMAAKYIQERQTPDGGYFFACIPPGNLLDTFFAVESLHILGLKPGNIAFVEHFISSFESDYAHGNIHALYLATGISSALGKPVERFRDYGGTVLRRFRPDELRQFDKLDIEVISELKSVVEAVAVFTRLNLQFDKKSVIDLILSLHNADGGFGRNQRSTPAPTFYAIQTLNLMKYLRPISEGT